MIIQALGHRTEVEVIVWSKHLHPGLALASPAFSLLNILEDVCPFAVLALFPFLRLQDFIHFRGAIHQRLCLKRLKVKSSLAWSCKYAVWM